MTSCCLCCGLSGKEFNADVSVGLLLIELDHGMGLEDCTATTTR